MTLLDDRFFDRFAVEYPPNEIIFCEYEPGNEFYFVQHGRVSIVKIINGREKTLDVMSVGDVFGEMSILEGEPRSASAITLDHVKVLKFHRDNFDALLGGNPQLAYKLLLIFSNRIYDAKRRYMVLLLDEPQLRVIDVLLMLAEKDPQIYMQDEISLIVSASQIASWAGMSLPDTEKILTNLNNSNKIKMSDNRIVITNIKDFQRVIASRRKNMHER